MTSSFEFETIPWTGELMAQEGEFGPGEINPEWEGEYGRRQPFRAAPRPERSLRPPPRPIRPRSPTRPSFGTVFPVISWNGSAPIDPQPEPQTDPACCSRCYCAQCSSDRQQSVYGQGAELEFEAPPSASPPRATFRLECPTGCAPFPANQCQTILRRAILDAIALANNAASKLTTSPRDSETIRLFRFFFGHDPSRPVPWADNEQSGATVAKRFLVCARELGGGRRTLYRCGCPGAGAGVRAITINAQEVSLCPRFWGASPQPGLSARFFRAGVILHEMLHQLFIEFILHDANERRRNNAHCYEAFAMRLAGHAADQSDVRQCRQQPA